MLRIACRVFCLTGAIALAACGTTPRPDEGAYFPSKSGIYRVGKPYEIGGTWYYPREQPDYDETGVASWYGKESGTITADGEAFTGEELTAAHPTLPLPVNVRVTNLENGRSAVLRVNDRGPFAKGRIIDVSRRAAELLGFYAQGTAKVRVTYLGRADLPNGETPSETPPEIVTAVAAAPSGRVQVASLNTPKDLPVATSAPRPQMPAPVQTAPIADLPNPDEPTGQVTTVPVPAVTHLYVQAGTFSSLDNANRLKQRLAAAGGLYISRADRNGRPFYRVRSGPYDDLESANAALARLSGLGNNDAEIVVDQ